MRTLAAMTSVAIAVGMFPMGCTTATGEKTGVTKQPAPATAQRAAGAVIQIDGMS